MAKASRWKNARHESGPADQVPGVDGGDPPSVEPAPDDERTERVAFAPVPGRDSDLDEGLESPTSAFGDEHLRAWGVPVVSGEDVEVVSVEDQAWGVTQSENDVDDLRSRLAELQQMVSQLADRSDRAEMQALEARRVVDDRSSSMSLDPELEASSRTLHLARQTADAVVAEARDEAAAILADAELQRAEIIRRSQQQAEAEFAAERDLVRTSRLAWEAERAQLVDHLERLDRSVSDYSSGLAGAAEAVAASLGTLGAPAREAFGGSLATPPPATDDEPVLSPIVDLAGRIQEAPAKKDPFPRTGDF